MPFEKDTTGQGWKEYPSLTSGNGALVKMPDWADEAVVEYFPTSAGTASLKVSLVGGNPNDDTGFVKTNIGDVTAHGTQVLSKVGWLAFAPASGTWTARVLFKR